MSRFARNHRVFYFEEPIFEEHGPFLRVTVCPTTHVQVCTPILPYGLPAAAIVRQQRDLLDAFLIEKSIAPFVSWYYTPMAREFSRHLEPLLTVYDCMDELSAFAGAPPAMALNEGELFEAASLVFTGGVSLFENKRQQHVSVHLYPSSVDVPHFAAARSVKQEPHDQRFLPRPRIGYAGVIDERMDLDLLAGIASLRPEWQFVLLGPIVKIDPAALPKSSNIHYLGMKAYSELPSYFSGWSIGMLPFARNQSTRYISPTKTPEYLAAGLQVISTSIKDVVRPYGELGLAAIADSAPDFIAAAEKYLQRPRTKTETLRVDSFLALNSWDETWAAMDKDIAIAINKKFSDPDETSAPPPFASSLRMKGAAHV